MMLGKTSDGSWLAKLCFFRSGLFVCVIMAALGSTATSAAAGWLDDKHEGLCQGHRGVNIYWHVSRVTSNPATCAANCFGYQLICRDGTKWYQLSRYPPAVSNLTIFFFENPGFGVLVKLSIFAPIAFVAFVATFGAKGWPEAARLQNSVVAGLFAVTLLVWGAGDMHEGEFSFARFLDYIVGSVMAYAIVPLFLIVSIPSFFRGWNYLFVAHPAAAIVQPAMRGKSVDVEGLANVLVEGAQDSGVEATYHYEHQTEKARALAEKLNADAAVAEARLERERRRAELAEAERYLKEAQRRSESIR